VRCQLTALSERETSRYIEHRLRAAGLGGSLPFTAGATARVYRSSRGVPRLINLICDRALLGAYATGQTRVKEAVVRRLPTRLRLDGDRLLLCATHTHAGPGGASANPLAQLGSGDADPRILPWLTARIAAAVESSGRRLVPCRLESSAGWVDGLAKNRRTPRGLVDGRLGVLRVLPRSGASGVLVAHMAMHPTVLPASHRTFSADFPGAFARAVESSGYALAVFVNGTEGDQAPAGIPGATPDAAVEVIGGRLAAAALRQAAGPAQPLRPVRAGKVALASDVAAPQALAAIATDCLGQITGNAEAMRAGRDGEFLHQLRVGVRRMRSLLQLASGMHDAAAIAAIDRDLVALSQVLGPARDWDVFAGTLAAIAPHLADGERRGFNRLRLRAARRRRFHRAATQSEAGSQRFTCLLLALGRLRTGLELATPDLSATALADDALTRSERRLHKRGKRLRQADAAARHRARVAAKKLRYAAEFFAPLFRHAGASGYVDGLASLQRTLGHLNDMAAASRLIDELLAPVRDDPELARAAGIVRGWTAASSARELERLPKSWRQFAKAKPFWH